jgi:imidazolonepropionase-like amidohydrolase
MKKNFTILFFLISFNSIANDTLIISKGIIDVKNASIKKEKYLIIRDDKIIKITNKLPNSKLKTLDLSNYFIFPGLVDSHAHLFFTQNISDKDIQHALTREANLADDLRINRAKIFLNQYINEGFTTIFDLGNSGNFLDAKLKSKIKNDPSYPTLFISGPGWASNNAQFDIHSDKKLVSKEYFLINQSTNIDLALSNYLNQDVDILKIYIDNSPSTGGLDYLLLKKLLNNPKIRQFKKITFHSISEEGSNKLINLKCESIEHFNFFNGNTLLNNIKFVTATDVDKDTLIEFLQYSPVRYISQINRTRLLSSTSVKILFGPDFYFHRETINFNRASYIKKGIKAFESAGLSPSQILKAMTYNPALSLKSANYFGQLDVGYKANIIASKINPLLNTSALFNIEFIMNKGTVIKNLDISK